MKQLIIDQKGVLWKIDQWNHYVVHHGPAPQDAIVIQGDFDGFKASADQFDSLLGKYTMRVTSQTTTYELTVTELTALIAKELNVSESKIKLRFNKQFVGTKEEVCSVDVEVQSK